jgi:hypothetical protein
VGRTSRPAACKRFRNSRQASIFAVPDQRHPARCSHSVAASSLRAKPGSHATVAQTSATSCALNSRPQCTQSPRTQSRPSQNLHQKRRSVSLNLFCQRPPKLSSPPLRKFFLRLPPSLATTGLRWSCFRAVAVCTSQTSLRAAQSQASAGDRQPMVQVRLLGWAWVETGIPRHGQQETIRSVWKLRASNDRRASV